MVTVGNVKHLQFAVINERQKQSCLSQISKYDLEDWTCIRFRPYTVTVYTLTLVLSSSCRHFASIRHHRLRQITAG